MFPIAVGHQRPVSRYRPGDAERGIAPQKPTIVLGRIIAAYFVDDLGIGLERAITVGEPFRYRDLVALRSAEHHRNMAAETWRAPADIDGDIEDRPRRHAQQLGLGERRNLEMQTAHHALAR